VLCSVNWLAQYVNLTVEPAELASRLTMAGLESHVEPRYVDRIEGVLIGRVVEVEAHPKADKLFVCTVETGSGQVRVVCGAPNVRPGMLSPLALPGARLKRGVRIKKTTLRGVESEGMLCAEDELGLSEDHSGIMDLTAEAKAGSGLEEIIDFNDHLLEVDLTPNRGDAASVFGIAREAAALLGQELRFPAIDYPESGPPAAELARVEILDPELCPRYAASLMTGLTVGPSPWWMREKLLSGGVRPINNLVDVTNYVLLELNQPLHSFDFERLAESRIVVRRARAGERFTTLDGQERKLAEGMLLICDGQRPVGLAGVMGGLNSEIEAGTTQVLLEAAFFEPRSNRQTATALGLQTEASYRFQRGVDPEGLISALKRATRLIIELGGGRAHPGLIDEHPLPWRAPILPLRVAKTNAYLGTELTGEEMAGLLNSIQVRAEVESEDRLKITVPPWRPDLTREVDLTEEVARLHGYDNIPATQPPMTEPAQPQPPINVLRERVRPLLTSAGLTQIITYSFIPPDLPRRLGWAEDDPRREQVPLINPLSEEQSVLRTSLLFGLLSTLESNLRLGMETVRIFEWGIVFSPRPEALLPGEETRLGGLLCGLGEPVSWSSSGRKVDFFDLKGVVEQLLAGLGLRGPEFTPARKAEYAPGQAAEVTWEGLSLGHLGLISRPARRAFDLKPEIFVFDLSADALLTAVGRIKPAYKEIPRYPSITRDVALVVEAALPAGRLLSLAEGFKEPLLTEVTLFDLYQGQPLAENEKSVGLRFRYRASDRTLTEEEITPVHQNLIAYLLENTKGRLRR